MNWTYKTHPKTNHAPLPYFFFSGRPCVALLAAAASDSIDQHEDHSEQDRGKDPYHNPFSTGTDTIGGASQRVDDQRSEYLGTGGLSRIARLLLLFLTSSSFFDLPSNADTEVYEGGNDAKDGNNDSGGDDDEATVQYSYSGNEEQESSSPPTDPTTDDPDMPPPLPPPQVELPSSSPGRGFIVSL